MAADSLIVGSVSVSAIVVGGVESIARGEVLNFYFIKNLNIFTTALLLIH